MRKMKRFASLLLATAMLFTSAAFTLSVSAAELPVVEVTDADWLVVEKLEALGAITNQYEDIGMYVTRRQMVDMIAKYLRIQATGSDAKKSPFLDVTTNDASIDNIIALYETGVITGDNEYKFHPDDNLTYDEAIVFVVNAVGHKLFAAREGGFPTGYHRIAIKEGMLEGLKFNSGKDFIPLCDVYKMLESALDVGAVVPVVFSDSAVDYQVSTTDSFLSDVYDIKKYQGIITGTENTHLTSPVSTMTDEQVEIDGVIYDTPGYVYVTDLGRAVYYYIREASDSEYDVAYVEGNSRLNNVMKIDSEDLLISKIKSDKIYYIDENEKERHLNMSDNIDVIYNGKCYRGYGSIKNVMPAYGFIEALDNSGDEEYDVLFVYDYKTVVVGSADGYDESFMSMFPNEDGVYEEFDLSVHGNKVNILEIPGDYKLEVRNLLQWDVATIMESKSDPKMYTIYISRQTVTGTVTEISDHQGVKINGTYYEISDDYVGSDITVGMGAIFYLDFNGKIVTTVRDASTAVGEYAVLTGIDYDDSAVASKIEARLYMADGTLQTMPLKSTVSIDGTRYEISSGLEKIAKVLSGEAQNEEGKYYIAEPSVIRAVISDGVISSIDTGNTGEDGKLQRLAYGSIEMLSRYKGFIRAKNDDDTNFYSYTKTNGTLIFCVPEMDYINDVASYKILKTLPDNKIYRKIPPNGVKYAFDVEVENYSLYNMKGSGIEVTEVILFNGVSVSTMNASANPSVVTKVTSAIGDDGRLAARLYLDQSTKTLVDSKFTINGGEEEISVENINDYIKPGMTITTGLSSEGLVNNINILVTYDDETGNLTSTSQIESKDIIDAGNAYNTWGDVVQVDPDAKLIQIDDGTRVQLVPITIDVIVYRTRTEQAFTGKLSDIAEGDTVVIRASSYHNINKVIVYKR